MGNWDLLRLQDVRSIYRLIGECRDLGYDPALWHPRVSEGRLIGAPMVSVGEGLWRRPAERITPLSTFAVGFDPRGYERLMAYMRENGPVDDPIYTALQPMGGHLLTHTRRQPSA